MTVDRDLSRKIMKRVRGENKMCWRNAICALVHLGPEWEYVEGWVSGGIILTQHGWVQHTETGAIVEATPCYLTEDHEGLTYHPGRIYGHSVALRSAVRDGTTLPLDSDFDLGVIPPDLMDAYREAHTAQYGEACTRWVFEKMRHPCSKT